MQPAPDGAAAGTAEPVPDAVLAPDAGTAPDVVASQDMSGHDHGELSVGVLVDEERFHVSSAVAPGQAVTVYNSSGTEVSITADDGPFDLTIPGRTFMTFVAPVQPGAYTFTSRHSAGFRDVLVVG